MIRKTSVAAFVLVTLCMCGFVVAPVMADTSGQLTGKFETGPAPNAAPTVNYVISSTGSLQVACSPGQASYFTIEVKVSDPNGNADIATCYANLFNTKAKGVS